MKPQSKPRPEYTPRRASKARWLQGAPEYIMDCFHDPAYPLDPWSILFTGSLLGRMCKDATKREALTDRAHTYIMGWGQQGSFELKAHEAANFRYHNGKHRIKWQSIPADIRAQIIAWATQD